MIHGSCGKLKTKSPSMKEGKCTKRFQIFFQNTQTGDDGYPEYRRRMPEDGGHVFNTKIKVGGIYQEIDIDNRWTVPHNLVLLMPTLMSNTAILWNPFTTFANMPTRKANKPFLVYKRMVKLSMRWHNSNWVDTFVVTKSFGEFMVSRYMTDTLRFCISVFIWKWPTFVL